MASMGIFNLENKRISFQGKEYNMIEARQGTKWINAEMSDDAGNTYRLKIKSTANIKVLGEANKKDIVQAVDKIDNMKAKREERSQERKGNWYSLIKENDALNGDYALIRTKGKINPIPHKMIRITSSGFFTRDHGRVRYMAERFVARIEKAPKGEKRSNQPIEMIGKKKKNEFEFFEWMKLNR